MQSALGVARWCATRALWGAALFLAVLAALLLFSGRHAHGQPPCDGAGCYRWRDNAEAPGEVCCWRLQAGGWVQVGAWSCAGQTYRPLFGPGAWGEPCEPPVEVPGRWRREAEAGAVPGGVLPEPTPGPRASLSGKPVTVEEGLKALEAPAAQLPNDGGKPWLVCVGDQSFRDRVAADESAEAVKPLAANYRAVFY